MAESSLLAEGMKTKEEIKPFVSLPDAFKQQEDEVLDMLVSSRALLEGHFLLESHQHSDVFFRFRSIAGSPFYLERIADLFIAQLKKDRVKFDAVLTQEAAGRDLGGAIADKLHKREIIVETDEENRPTKNLINESTLYRGDRVLLVTDLMTTGSSLQTMADLVRDRRAVPVAVAVFATRNKEAVREFEREQALKVYNIVHLAVEQRTVDAADCQFCTEAKPYIASWEV